MQGACVLMNLLF